MTLGEKIRTARESKNLTQKQLASLIGAKHNSISNWENDQNKPDISYIELLSGVFGVDPSYFFEKKTADIKSISLSEKRMIEKFRALDQRGQTAVNNILNFEYEQFIKQAKKLNADKAKDNVKYIEYYNLPVSAGTGIYLDGDYKEMIEVPSNDLTAGANFALRVSGDSMEPQYFDGDILLIKSQPCVISGDLGIFILNNEGYFKKFEDCQLISLNPKYSNIKINEYDNLICKGKVIGKL